MDILQELKTRRAVFIDQHFVYAKGGHGPKYINIDPALPDIEFIDTIGRLLAQPFIVSKVDTVVAPAIGGIPLAYATARRFGQMLHDTPKAVWADKVKVDGQNDFAFERDGFMRQLSGKRVLVVEDLLNSAGSVMQVVAHAREAGAEVVGIAVVCNRGPETAKSLGVPLHAIETVKFDMFDAADCPLCAAHVPIVEDIGHGSEYKREHPDYIGGYVRLLES